jgi:hypothetical protein
MHLVLMVAARLKPVMARCGHADVAALFGRVLRASALALPLVLSLDDHLPHRVD